MDPSILDPYYLGTIINFSRENFRDFPVHNRNCSLEQLYKVHDHFKQFKPFSKVDYMKYSAFRASLTRQIDDENWKTLSPEKQMKFFQGVIDMNAEINVHRDQLELNIYSENEQFLSDFHQTLGIPGILSEQKLHKLTYLSTNAIDLMGLFPNSYKHTTLNIYIQGLGKLSKCGVVRRDPMAILPSKSRWSDVGYDIHIIRKHKTLNATTALYDTGLILDIPLRYYVEIVPRSSLSKTGYMLANSIGIIDPSYRGNLYIALTKVSPDAINIEDQFPFRCCQIIFKKHEFVQIEEIHKAEETSRGEGGFGSTGV
jgi:deoxyuridine 5'-triphosphate nucleotidohydrolase